MRNRAIDARIHSFDDKDDILPDANFWLYLYGPAADPTQWTVQTYSKIFSRLLVAGSKLFLDVLVLSEFINKFARLEMRRLKPTQTDFKAFRSSTDFPTVAAGIKNQVQQILTVCNPLDHPFSEWKHDDLLKDFGTGSVDWNDQLIIENCRKHGLAVLTNDKDFTTGGISVFTANGKLLSACQ